MSQDLSAVALNCTLKQGPMESSTQLMTDQVLEALEQHGVHGASIRVVDHDVKPGVELDQGEGDEWPSIRARILAADLVIVSTPIWLGQPSSICQRVLERLDAELSETDDEGRPRMYGKVAAVAIVGNEDGAHHVSGILFQAMNDLGFSIAPGAVTYWNGEAMHAVDYKDLPGVPETVASTTTTLAANSCHLARLLRTQYPPSQ